VSHGSIHNPDSFFTPLLKKVIKGCRKRRRNSQKELYEMFYAYGMSITLRYADTRDDGVMILNDAFMKVFSNISIVRHPNGRSNPGCEESLSTQPSTTTIEIRPQTGWNQATTGTQMKLAERKP
jgi:hypothetical protein